MRTTGTDTLARHSSFSSSWAAGIHAPLSPLPASVQTFLPLRVSLAGAGTPGARPGRPLARRDGAGRVLRAWKSRGGKGGARGRAGPTAPRPGMLSAAAAAPLGSRCCRLWGAERPPWAGNLGNPALPGPPIAPLNSASRGPALKSASPLHCLQLRVGDFPHLLRAGRHIWVLGREVRCFRSTLEWLRCVSARTRGSERRSGEKHGVRARAAPGQK